MKYDVFLLAALGLLTQSRAHGQFSFSDVQFWAGSGPDSSVLVIDFQSGAFVPCYAWGYLHDGTSTAEDMLNDITAWDENLLLDMPGGVLNEVNYVGNSSTTGGVSQWFTWTGTDIGTMTQNSGTSEPLSNGEWFGCSFGAMDSPLPPNEPQPALDPYGFTFADVELWIGSGPDSAVMVIDFQNGSTIDSYAWGYLFNTITYGSTMLADIAAADPLLHVTFSGGWVDTISYDGHIGVEEDPDYWTYWEGFNFGGSFISYNIDPFITNGLWFGCSYTDFAPVLRPGYPSAASVTTGIPATPGPLLQVYPQPAADVLYVNAGRTATALTAYDASGRRVLHEAAASGLRSVDVRAWPAGIYLLDAGGAKRAIAVQH